MISGHLYGELATYYDLIYSRKDYKSEAMVLRRLIRENKQSRGKELLEVGCGTGAYLEQFERHFSCSGVDLSPAMLGVARSRLNKKTFLEAGDMRTFDLGVQFDVVLCLFSSIANLKTSSELRQTMQNLAKHLKPGGVMIIGPWLRPRRFAGAPRLFTYDSPDLKVARVDLPKLRGNKNILDFHWLIAEKGKPVRYIAGDHHELTAFSNEQYFKSMQAAKLQPRFLEPEQSLAGGLYLGVKAKPGKNTGGTKNKNGAGERS